MTDENWKQLVDMVDGGMSLTKAARHFGVPKTTAHDRYSRIKKNMSPGPVYHPRTADKSAPPLSPSQLALLQQPSMAFFDPSHFVFDEAGVVCYLPPGSTQPIPLSTLNEELSAYQLSLERSAAAASAEAGASSSGDVDGSQSTEMMLPADSADAPAAVIGM